LQRLRVGLIVPSLGVGGAVETPAVSALVAALDSFANVTVFALQYPAEAGRGLVDGVPVWAMGGQALRTRALIRRTLRAIRATHQRAAFDVLHGLWLFEPGFIAALAGSLLRVPSLASIGGVEVVSLPDIGVGGLQNLRGRLLCRLVARRAGLVAGGSTYVQELGRRLAPRRPISDFRLAPLPVDVARFGRAAAQPRPATEAVRLLHVAGFIPVKDQATLLRAFAIVHHAHPAAHLTMVGADPRGMRADLEGFASALGVRAAVEFLDELPNAQLPPVYAAADVFVLSSRHESQGMVVLEAAAAGLPTVGTAVGVVPDLSPSAALAVPVGDADAMARALRTLVNDAALRARMGEAARAMARDEYDITPVARRFEDIYSELAFGRVAREASG
jgi:glycosyltransferase involved in cell wall biosynthesis